MDIIALEGLPDSSFVPEACTLPTAARPLRLAEFTDLFASALRRVRRTSPTRLDLTLEADSAVEASARDLAARETQCCAFFTFTFGRGRPGYLEMAVAVSEAHVDVLDGLQRLAASSIRDHGPA